MNCKESFFEETYDITKLRPYFTPDGDICNFRVASYANNTDESQVNLIHGLANCDFADNHVLVGRLIKIDVDHSGQKINGIRLTTDSCHCDEQQV